ncbi:hypothetical protein GQ44DRAFT_733762 [Phaeosphaeriaceae sp. PMI808]|nr:hypothetical protein GQ44DRAFT_733762 [Phaeosphaeriaceae sp. PMI808]
MFVNWKPDTPLRVMAEESERYRRTNQAQKVRRRVFNDKGQSREQVPRVHRNTKRDIQEIEGIFEVQRMLFLKLAGQENRVKGFSKLDTIEWGKSVQSNADLEQLIVDTAQAVQATWSKRSKTRRTA